MKALPKSLLKAIARHLERFDEGWDEQDGFGERRGQWSHWVYLAPGWRNAVLDPVCALHVIHETTVAEAVQQFNGAKPCDCDECLRELKQITEEEYAARCKAQRRSH